MNWLFDNIELVIEITAVIFGVLYVILIAKNKVSAWIFGIIGSLISIYLFIVYAKLYAEAVLYLFYVFAGIYGWIKWKKHDCPEEVYQQKLSTHIKYIGVGTVLSVMLYFGINYLFVDAEKPLIDSFTTIFSFIATYLTAKKWIENWLYWIVIDAVTTYLYYSRGLEIYAFLMFAYTIIAVYGFLQWKKLKVVQVD